MDFSVFSFLMALFWCSIFVLCSTILRHKTDFVLKYGVDFILIIITAGIIRLFMLFELPFSVVIPSNIAMPLVQQYFREELFMIGSASVDLIKLLFFVWVSGSVLYMLSIAMWIFRMKCSMKKISTKDSTREARVLDSVMRECGTKRKCHIIVSSHVETPMLVGYFVPTILLPELVLSDEEIKYVLLHEWNHFVQKHLWIKLFFNVFCALLWWNPLAYLVKRDLDHILEVSCDRAAVKGLCDYERIRYVEATTNVMKQLAAEKPSLSLSSIGFVVSDSGSIVQRCELVLFPPKKLGKSSKHLLCVCILFLIVLSYTFVLQPYTPALKDTIGEHVVIGPENSCLYANGDGTYRLFMNEQFIDTIGPNEINALPFSGLTIKEKDDTK